MLSPDACVLCAPRRQDTAEVYDYLRQYAWKLVGPSPTALAVEVVLIKRAKLHGAKSVTGADRRTLPDAWWSGPRCPTSQCSF